MSKLAKEQDIDTPRLVDEGSFGFHQVSTTESRTCSGGAHVAPNKLGIPTHKSGGTTKSQDALLTIEPVLTQLRVKVSGTYRQREHPGRKVPGTFPVRKHCRTLLSDDST